MLINIQFAYAKRTVFEFNWLCVPTDQGVGYGIGAGTLQTN